MFSAGTVPPENHKHLTHTYPYPSANRTPLTPCTYRRAESHSPPPGWPDVSAYCCLHGDCTWLVGTQWVALCVSCVFVCVSPGIRGILIEWVYDGVLVCVCVCGRVSMHVCVHGLCLCVCVHLCIRVLPSVCMQHTYQVCFLSSN